MSIHKSKYSFKDRTWYIVPWTIMLSMWMKANSPLSTLLMPQSPILNSVGAASV